MSRRVETGASSLTRALELLDAIADGSEQGMTASELAAATGMNRVTVHRLLSAFKAHAFVRQPQPRGPYRLGFRLLELAEHVITELELVRTGQPILEELCDDSGETCHLAVLDGVEAVYVAKVEPPQAVRLVSRLGRRVPLHSTGLGKAMLASLDEAVRESLLQAMRLERRTDQTMTSLEAMREDLDEIAARGFATDRGENEEGVHCVACAIPAPSSVPLAAISVSGPSVRVTQTRFEELGPLVQAAARRLSEALRR